MDRRALWPMIHGVTKSQTQLSYKHFHFGSWGLGSHEGEWCPYKKDSGAWPSSRGAHSKFQKRAIYEPMAQASANISSASTRILCCWSLLILKNLEECLSFITYSLYDILLYPPKQTKIYISPRCIDKCYQLAFICTYICLPLHSVNKPYMSRNNI